MLKEEKKERVLSTIKYNLKYSKTIINYKDKNIINYKDKNIINYKDKIKLTIKIELS